MKLSDYIAQFLVEKGVKHVFGITGGAIVNVFDSIGKDGNISYICTHHEQAAAMAAEAYSRVTGNIGVALVTSGPGGTNAVTGVLCAWQDSIPLLVISGQVRSDRLEDKPIRQLSIQGFNITRLVESITKYAVTIRDPKQVKYHLEKASYLAKTGRPGSVWLDIPLDVQSASIEPDELESFHPDEQEQPSSREINKKVKTVIELVRDSERPIILIGTGVRLAKAENEILELINMLKFPFLYSWNAQDLVSHDDPLYMGSPGVFGVRYANFAVQNCDLLLAIGSRLSIAQTGHNYKAFARAAKKIAVDIDKNELEKGTVTIDLPIHCDAKVFLVELLRQLKIHPNFTLKNIAPWVERCQQWKARYPIVLPAYREEQAYVNSYVFIDILSEELTSSDVIALGVGTAFTGTFQSFKAKRGQRLFHSGGAAPMGYCLPAAIGTCFGIGKRRAICITGDGCIQLNIQELQTIVYHNLPIKIFMYNNQGYLTIRITQDGWLNSNYQASSQDCGLSFPDMQKICQAYGLKTERIEHNKDIRDKIRSVLASDGPMFCEVMMDPAQPLIPYLTYGKKADGSSYPLPLEDMYPLLDRKEFMENMIIEPWVEPD